MGMASFILDLYGISVGRCRRFTEKKLVILSISLLRSLLILSSGVCWPYIGNISELSFSWHQF